MIHELTIRYSKGHGYDVIKDGLSSGGGLTVGEMIEQVLSVSAPASSFLVTSGRSRYPMKPPSEWHMSNPQEDACELPVVDLGVFFDDVGSGV